MKTATSEYGLDPVRESESESEIEPVPKSDEAKPVSRRETGVDCSEYLTVYQAALSGDWEAAKKFFGEDINGIAKTIISSYFETALHIAVLSGEANGFVTELVKLIPQDAAVDWVGDSALHNAAGTGNTDAVEVLVKKYPSWLLNCNNDKNLPVMKAVIRCKKPTLKFLISKHKEKPEYNIFKGQQGIRLLNQTIASEFLDVALDLAKNHPILATLTDEDKDSALSTIATTHELFQRLETFGWGQRLIYHCIPSNKYKSEASPVAADIENGRDDGAVQNWFQIIIGGKLTHSHF